MHFLLANLKRRAHHTICFTTHSRTITKFNCIRDPLRTLDREIELARALQEATGQHQDWVVLREEIRSEIRRLTRQETTQLALQMGRLLAHVQDRKAELRSAALPAFADLQMSLQGLLRVPGRPSDSNSIAGNKQVGGQS